MGGAKILCYYCLNAMTVRLHKHPFSVRYFASNLSIVIGLVLIWRGVWYVLDGFDLFFFGGSHVFSAALGIVAGLLILYLPDKNLDELKKL